MRQKCIICDANSLRMLTIGIIVNTRSTYDNTRDGLKKLNKSYMIIIVYLFGFLLFLSCVFVDSASAYVINFISIE